MKTDTVPPTTNAPSQEEVLKYKRRLFETASRSYLNDQLTVQLPPELHGEWLGIDDFSQYHASIKGFVDGTEYITEQNKLFQRPDGSTLGDVKFMIIPKWKYDAQRELAAMESAAKAGLQGKDEVDSMYSKYSESLGLERLAEKTTTKVIETTNPSL